MKTAFAFGGMTVAAWIALTGCAGPRMVPPEDVAKGSQVLEVQNRSSASGLFVNESFQLGAYKVSDVDRQAVGKSTFSVGGYNTSKTTTGYSYKLSGGKGEWNGACAFNKAGKGVAFAGGSFGKSDFSLTCECTGAGQQGRLELKNEGDKLAGTMTAGKSSFQVTRVDKTDKKTFGSEPSGYRFDAADGPRGAVEVLHPGRLWLNEKLAEEEREPASCLMTGLMLYKEPTEN